MAPNLYVNDTGEAGNPAVGVEKWGDAITGFQFWEDFTGCLSTSAAT